MILDTLLSIAQDSIIDSEQLSRFNDESGFFPGLANCGVTHQFSDLQHAAGDRPLRLQGWVRALDEQDALIFDDDGADSDERDLRKFTFHHVKPERGL